MIDNKLHLREVGRLCAEVSDLVIEVFEQTKAYDEKTCDGRMCEPHPALGTKLSGELRRRSMDLTRALAQLRSSR